MRWALKDAMTQLFDPQFTVLTRSRHCLENLDSVAAEIVTQVH